MSSSGTWEEVESRLRCAACQRLEQPVCDHPERFAAVQQQQQASAAAGGAVVTLPPCGEGEPCAACQYLKRPCAPDCVFAAHFPAGDDSATARFAAVRAVYGAEYFTEYLRSRSPKQRTEAIDALVQQATEEVNRVMAPLLEEMRKNARLDSATGAEAVVVEQPAADVAAGVTNFETPMDQEWWADEMKLALLEALLSQRAADVPGSSTAGNSAAWSSTAVQEPAFLMQQLPPQAPTAAADVPGSSTAFPEPAAATAPAFLMQQPPPQAPTAAAGGVQDQGLPEADDASDKSSTGSS